MITFGRKLKHLRQKNHLTQKELGMAVGFPDSCADTWMNTLKGRERAKREALNIVGLGKRNDYTRQAHTLFDELRRIDEDAVRFWQS